MLTGFETENKYDVIFENGLRCVALEESNVLARMCLGASRPFSMKIVFADTKQEFLRLERPYCLMFHEISVIDSIKKETLGSIKLQCSFCSKEFSVCDPSGQEVYHITSPVCSWWSFYVEKGGSRVGEIKKKWSGFLKEMYTDADNFGVHFPPNATAKEKALIFGATFLIDFLYFETSGNNNRRNH